MKIAVYAGTIDPITKGHISVLSRAAKLFDKVIVAVAADNNKYNRHNHSSHEPMPV